MTFSMNFEIEISSSVFNRKYIHDYEKVKTNRYNSGETNYNNFVTLPANLAHAINITTFLSENHGRIMDQNNNVSIKRVFTFKFSVVQ